jgi:DNA end-binding protein Ku
MSRAHGGSAVAERRRSHPRRRHSTKPKDEPRGRLRGSPGGGGQSASPGGPRPVWSGSISFGLVNIPVRLFTAVREQRVAFHLLHDQDKARLRRKIVSSTTGKEIHPEHIVRGYEVAKDKYVVVTQEELEACAPEKTRAIEITDFVHLSEIDPVYYERPYYVLPQKGAARSYRLILAAMKRSKRVGIARVVIHEKEYLAALRPLGDLIVLSTMNLHDEIVPVEPIEHQVSHVHVAEREVKAAEKVIGSMTEKFDPKRYRDEYRDCVLKAIERRAQEEAPVAPPAPAGGKEKASKPHEARAADLMSALEASLARAKNQAKRRKSA